MSAASLEISISVFVFICLYGAGHTEDEEVTF